jgi:uncharacterized protein YbcI
MMIVKKELTMSSPHDPLDALAQDFLKAWQDAHGVKSGRVFALRGDDHLAIIIENSFSKAERKLAEEQSGENLLREYATQLLNNICSEMKIRIEQMLKREVLSSEVSVSLDTDRLIFLFRTSAVDE